MDETMFTILDSVSQAYTTSENEDLKAELFLSVCKNNKISKDYAKTIKNISKISRKTMKLGKKDKHDAKNKIEFNIKNDLIAQAKQLTVINDADLISKQLINRYKNGLMISNLFKKVYSVNCSYGRLVLEVFKELSAGSLFENIKTIVGKKKQTYFQNVIVEYPELNDKSFVETERGALILESHLIIYLIQQHIKNLSEDELKGLLDEIIKEIGKEDLEIEKIFKQYCLNEGIKLATELSKAILELLRLSVGKGVFMNSAVKIANVMLRSLGRTGMSFSENAIFRRYVARTLASGPYAIVINILLCVPDVASLVNRRDYNAIIKSLMFLYFLRNEGSTV